MSGEDEARALQKRDKDARGRGLSQLENIYTSGRHGWCYTLLLLIPVGCMVGR